MHGIVHVAYACECCDCPEFRDEIHFKDGRDMRKFKFLEKG